MSTPNGIHRDLKNLLSDWKLDCLLSHLTAEKIDIYTLEMMKMPHIRMLLHNFPLGIQIRFEYHLEQWRKDIGKPLQVPGNEAGIHLYSQRDFKVEFSKNDMKNKATQVDLMINNFIVPTEITKNKNSETVGCNQEITNCSSSAENEHIELNSPDQLSALKLPRPTYTHQIDLQAMLSNSTCGIGLINNYRLRKRLSNSERKMLMATIVNYFLENNLEFNLQMSYALERAILKMFPSEKISFYRTTKCGKLYMRYIRAKNAKKQEAYVLHESINLMAGSEDGFSQFSPGTILINNDNYTTAPEMPDLTHFENHDIYDNMQIDHGSRDSSYIDLTADHMENSTEIKIEPENIQETSPFTLSPKNCKLRHKKQKEIAIIEKLFKDFVIPWHKLPYEIIVLMENKLELGKSLNMFANIIVDEMRKISTHLPICVLRSITTQAVAKYPYSFLEKDSMGNLIASSSIPLLSTMRYRNCNLNRTLLVNNNNS